MLITICINKETHFQGLFEIWFKVSELLRFISIQHSLKLIWKISTNLRLGNHGNSILFFTIHIYILTFKFLFMLFCDLIKNENHFLWIFLWKICFCDNCFYFIFYLTIEYFSTCRLLYKVSVESFETDLMLRFSVNSGFGVHSFYW